MQPQQQQQQPPPQPGGVVPGPANQYDFIVNPPQQGPPKGGLSILGGGGTSNKKFFVIVGGGMGLVILLLLFAFVFTGGNANVDRAVGLVQTQGELARVSDKGSEATDGRLRYAATTAKLTINTHKQEWLAYLSGHGRQLSNEELAAKLDGNTDSTLDSAQQTGTFDSTFEQILDAGLRGYAAELLQVHSESSQAEVRDLAEAHLQQLELLVEQLSGRQANFWDLPDRKNALSNLVFLPRTTALSAR